MTASLSFLRVSYVCLLAQDELADIKLVDTEAVSSGVAVAGNLTGVSDEQMLAIEDGHAPGIVSRP